MPDDASRSPDRKSSGRRSGINAIALSFPCAKNRSPCPPSAVEITATEDGDRHPACEICGLNAGLHRHDERRIYIFNNTAAHMGVGGICANLRLTVLIYQKSILFSPHYMLYQNPKAYHTPSELGH
jgi:hypothetical protein